MHFQQPTALWFLPLLVVPLILHLVNLRRYKVLAFPNVLTLSRLKEEEQQRNKLKHRLILLSRTLALAALILFFAAPTFTSNSQAKPQQYSIFLDNSPSVLLASNSAEDGLQESIQRVRAYIHSLPDEAKIQILTGEFFASDQIYVSKTQALQRLNQIAGGAPSRTISEVIQRQRLSLPDEKSPLGRLIVSDFQRNILPFPTATDSLG
ncbi:MAG: BatA domain-containing protein, partial [Flavobacteriales bacterium]